MFERTLQSLIKGLRSHRGADEAAFVTTLLGEIRHELRSGDMEVKAGAVLKLTYLQMMGYPCSGASFPILEVMASPSYHLKQVGYLAATHTFTHDTDVLILVTNLIKKDLHSPNPLDVAIALNGLSHIVTPDLAQHVVSDLVGIMNHSRPAIRKKAILAFYAVAQQYPQALEQGWHRLQEKLQDDDPAVVSATVNIVCELATRDPRPFLPLSPQLFDLLRVSSNNWMLIKIVKLFGHLAPIEPRLTRKLLPPIKALIANTPAMSLLYECIHSVISGDMLNSPGGDELAQECVDRLAAFLDDEDRNLRYIALLALVRILPTHPHLVARLQQDIFAALYDHDLSIRLRALDLVTGMASPHNTKAIIDELMAHLENQGKHEKKESAPSAAAALMKQTLQVANAQGSISKVGESSPQHSQRGHRMEMARRILVIGARDAFANIEDFEWYAASLLRLVNLPDLSVDRPVGDQLLQICLRVDEVRPYLVGEMSKLVLDVGGRISPPPHLLQASACICGEFAEHVENPRLVVPALLRKSLVIGQQDSAADGSARQRSQSHPSVSAAALHNAVKLFAYWAATLSAPNVWSAGESLLQVKNVAEQVSEGLATYSTHSNCEVAERATEYLQLFALLKRDLNSWTKDGEQQQQHDATSSRRGPKSLHLLSPLFHPRPAGAVNVKARSKVAAPRGLDLRAPIVAPSDQAAVCEELVERREKTGSSSKKKAKGVAVASDLAGSGSKSKDKIKTSNTGSPSDAPLAESKQLRSKSKGKGKLKISETSHLDDEDMEDIPIVQLTMDDLPGFSSAKQSQTAALSAAEGTEPPTPKAVKTAGSSKKKKMRASAAVID